MTRAGDPYRPRPPKPPPVLALGRDVAVGPCTVLAVVDRYPPDVNAGAEWMLHRMLADSARRGHTVRVAAESARAPYTLDGVDVGPPGKVLGRKDTELVVGHLAWTHRAIDAATKLRVPLVYLMHNDDQPKWWGINRDRVSVIVWNSVWLAAKCRTAVDVRAVPGTVIRPAVHRDPPSANTREMVTLVNPIHAKGAGTFYEVARRRPDLRFLVVEGAYGHQMDPPGGRAANVVRQPQTADMAADVWARTRVLLAPSQYESWGLAACEALAAGIPVVAAPTPGLVEAMGGAAMFAAWDDPDAWCDALTALDDPTTYATQSEAALRRADWLQVQAARDLDRWDVVVHLAAGATRVRSGAMTQVRPHDPFSHRPAPDDWEPATPPVAAQDAPAEDPATGTPGEAPDAQEANPAPVEAWPVPEKAADIVVALRQTNDPDEQRARAEAVKAAEDQRDGGHRASVDRAVAEILGS